MLAIKSFVKAAVPSKLVYKTVWIIQSFTQDK
jgi:hypothetical protein